MKIDEEIQAIRLLRDSGYVICIWSPEDVMNMADDDMTLTEAKELLAYLRKRLECAMMDAAEIVLLAEVPYS